MKYKLTSNTWGREENNAINKVLKSQMYTYGKTVKKFEDKFAKYHNSKYAIMVNSGSSANLLALFMLKYKFKNPFLENDEIIVPALSWSTTYYPVSQAGYKIVLVDIDKETLNIDIDLVEKAITKKTRAIMAVSILGNPANLIELKRIAKKNNLILIEDNCESLGAQINNNLTGTFGELSTFSFFFSHHISTGEGGMVLTNNFEYYNILKSLRSHGWSRDLDKNFIKKLSKNKNYEDYEFHFPGFNVRPMEFNAATGIEQLKKLNMNIKIRRKNLETFQNLFIDNKYFYIQKENGNSSSFSFPMILKNKYKFKKESIYKFLRSKKIDFRLLTGGCITCHPVIHKINHRISGKLTNSIYSHKYGMFVGNHPVDISKELNYLNKCLDNLKI